MRFDVTFWGVRGTVPCPMPSHLAVGGNTSCIQVTAGDETVLLDAGTGLRMLGCRSSGEFPHRATMLLTHTHLDHISGFPFFAPFFDPAYSFRIMAGHLSAHAGIRAVLSGIMDRPLFPVPLLSMQSEMTFEDFGRGDVFDIAPDVRVRTASLNHPPDGATAYRIEHAGRSLAYVTDTEHTPGRQDERILDLIDGADLVIYDATYTDEEFPGRIGWGHSTWQEGVRLALAAKARRLALFHHSPDHDDRFMAEVEAQARECCPNVFVAREGMTVSLA